MSNSLQFSFNILQQISLFKIIASESKKLYDVLSWKNLKLISDSSVSKNYMLSCKHAVVLSAAGMLSKGRSRLWLKHIIEDSRNTTLDRFIYSLSIPQIGRSASKDIAKFFNNNYEEFKMYGTTINYTQIDGFGESMNNSLHKWLNENHIMMEELAKEFTFRKEKNNSSSVDLSGKIFVITGSLIHYKNRDELVSIIESMGGKVSGSVSTKTSYLINNDTQSSSSKNQKAKQLNIPIISEEDFINMIS